jgi:archaemetzincin
VTRERKTIRLVALDDLAVGLNPSLDLLVEGIGAFYGLPVVVHKAAAVPKFPTRVGPLGTPQFLTDDVMRWLKTEVPSDAYCLVALTRTDLYPDPAWNFVFGVGSFMERTGVFSFARYDLDPLGKDASDAAVKERRALLLRRSMKVLTHELGHLFGMEHCIEHACLMNGCNHLREMDGQPSSLCPVCLRKVMDTTKGKVEARYAAIEAFDRREGLVAEADWYHARLDYLLEPTKEPFEGPARGGYQNR